jgi:futalosine hydrolase
MKYGPSVESMEGAAFFYVCRLQQVNCIQVRAVSNMVKARDRKSWKTSEAIDALEGLCGLLLLDLENIDLSSIE